MKSISEIHISQEKEWQEYNEYRQKKVRGLRTGIPELDKLILGLTGIVGIQGEPGACKSTLALQIARHNAESGTPVLIVDRENGKHRFKDRLIAQIFRITLKMVQEAPLEAARSWYQHITSLGLYVETAPCEIDQLRVYLRELWDKHEKPMLLVMDSLQALPRGDLEERLGLQKWLEDLDQLKLDFQDQLTIILTSEKTKGSFGTPSKDGGKGTASIGYKCEQLLDLREDKASGLIFVDLVKNRDGAKFQNFCLELVMLTKDPNSFIFELRDGSRRVEETEF